MRGAPGFRYSPMRLAARVRLVAALVGMVALAGVVRGPVFALYRISGSSMLPHYRDGDRVLVTNLPFLTGGVRAGDTVIAEVEGEVLIKRVVAEPGDEVEVRDGVLIRNGMAAPDFVPVERLDHAYLAPVRLGDDEYFLLGDNRRVSVDSRSFGPLHADAILGEVVHRFAPPEVPQATAAASR